MQQPQVVILNKRKYATGLFWQPVGSGYTPRNYAHAISKNIPEHLKMFVEYRSMIGLGGNRLGHKSGMLSLAAEVIDSFAEYSSFLAAFRVDNSIWIIAVRNGIIIADKLYYDEVIAKAVFEELYSMTEWAALIAPGQWGKLRAIETKLEEIVLSNFKYSLKAISHFKGNLINLILLVLFGFVLFEFFKAPIMKIITPQKQSVIFDTKLAQEYKKRIEQKNKILDSEYEIIKAEPVKLVMPYEQLPNITEHTKICWQAIGFLMQSIPGWSQDEVVCNVDSATAVLKRETGTINDFYEIGDKIMPGVTASEISDSEIHLTVKLPQMENSFSVSKLDAASVLREINSLFQRANMKINIAQDFINITSETLSKDVAFINVSAESKLNPIEFIQIFNGFDGASIQMIEWDNNRYEWNYEVRIYVK